MLQYGNFTYFVLRILKYFSFMTIFISSVNCDLYYEDCENCQFAHGTL